jgi:hypothetical protein
VPPEASDDEEALRWEGDEAVVAPPRRPAPAAVAEPADTERTGRRGGGASLVVLGVLGGIALLETLGWIRSVTGVVLASTISPGNGTPVELVAFGVNVLGRIAAVLAAPLWFAVVVWRVRAPLQRIAWLLVGALVLVPWPALLHLA